MKGYCTDIDAEVECQLDAHLREVINKTWNYAGRCDTREKQLLNAVLGLAGEAGETADIYKKELFHTAGKDRQEEKLSELGDVMFYLTKLIQLEGFTVAEVLAYNRKKLASRHPELGEVKERFGKGAIR